MAETIDDLLTRTVRTAVRDSLEEMRPTLVAAVRESAPTPGPMAPATYVSAKEAGRIMGAHPKTVRKLVAEGKLGRYSVEGQLRVKVSDVHAYMAREGQPSPTIDLDERALEILSRRSR